MKKLHLNVSLLLIGVMFLLAEGCTHKDLNEDAHTTIADNVKIVFDWSKAPATQASSMALYLYPEDHEVMNYWFKDRTGGIIKSYGGRHTAICHSNDDPYTHLMRNTHAHNESEIYTDNTVMLVGQGISTRRLPRAPGTEDEPLRVTPTMIYGTQDSKVNIKVSGLSQTVTFYPEELVCHYTVEFLDVKNLKNNNVEVDATISSMAGGYYPGRMKATTEAVSHTFTLTPDAAEKSLRTEFMTFGVPDGEELPHKLCLYIVMNNRTGNFYTFDVTEQVNKAPDPRHVTIRIYGLELPDIPDEPITPPQGEGGLSVDIETWEVFYFGLTV